MIQFVKTVINEDRVIEGIGEYEKIANTLTIHFLDQKIERAFLDLFMENTKVQKICFQDKEGEIIGGFRGPYYLTSIKGEIATMEK